MLHGALHLMPRPDLVLELRAAVHQAIKERSKVRKEGIRIRNDGGYRIVNLQVLPLPDERLAEPHYLVLFEPGSEAPAVARPDAETPDATNLRIQTLGHELLTSREYMQAIIDEQEATNEEHENRNQELMSSNSDLANLLASVELAIVILSDDLRIRRFTPTAKSLLNLIDTDIGRPIGNIRPNVNIPDLETRVQEVIDTMSAQSIEVQDSEGRCYTLSSGPTRRWTPASRAW